MESIEGSLKVKSVFTVSGRGIVIAGDILDGTLKIGMYTQTLRINGKEQRLKVDGVEFVDYISEKRADLCLFFSQSITKKEMEDALPENCVINCSYK